MSMDDIQISIDEWAQTLEEPYWPPLSQFARVAEEVGEVGRLLNHMYGSKPKKAEEAAQELGEELADVIFALVCIANRHDINLDKEINKVIEKAKNRDKDRFKKK
jgi:NTP pyrophosphatase (non-canonical NTP hydrolase)